jgi:sulfite exporter TauE/SafE
MNQIWLAFLTGLTTGGISCIAVQGGLLASSLSNQTEKEITNHQKITHVTIFLIAKIVSYTILGFLLGAIGSALIISSPLQAWMHIGIGIFMILTAARLLDIHPVFRYFVIQPPRAIYKIMKNEAKNKSMFTPALLGAMTVLIPCGVTQAMMVLAVGTRSSILGALILCAFVIGTSPVFFTIGLATQELMKKKSFMYIASFVIVILGILSINSGQTIRGSSQTLQNYFTVIKTTFSDTIASTPNDLAKVDNQGKQIVTIDATSNGYSSQVKTLKVGIPVKLTLASHNVQSCARSFLIPSVGISKILPENGAIEIEFTPTKTGTLAYTCGMGMYSGSFTVI